MRRRKAAKKKKEKKNLKEKRIEQICLFLIIFKNEF